MSSTLVTKQFVPNGFHFDKGKQDVAWLDADTLLVSRDWGRDSAGHGTLTRNRATPSC